ncbi:MAG: hypothetical protein OXC83_01275 [Chloroflexi bacterium]|nr:hypothetical protein [Chloroflexota bacterium]
MASGKPFEVDIEEISIWDVPVINLHGGIDSLTVSVHGIIANSVPTSLTGKANLKNWKIQIASKTKATRGDGPWDPSKRFAITLGMSFCPGLHGGRDLDIENFVKPIVDALAAGLFCAPETEPAEIQRFDYDDSNFNTLLIHRLPDTAHRDQEGVAIHVSVT